MELRFHFLKRGAEVSEIEWQSSAMSLQVLIVYQSRSGATLQLAESLVAGIESASDLIDIEITTVKRSALLGTSKDVRSADALVIATPEHFGSMAGATKVFFEEIWAGCLDQTQGLPWQLLVKAGTDGAQTTEGVQKLAKAQGWKQFRPPLLVVGDLTETALNSAFELGQLLAVSLDNELI
ncbi:MAG: NAD(P)H-dependent oxidoreductase [Acidimicrobiales bacterium]|nr:NAD(P)H-dependent oxidoreductase [Acidimicrobiales bacterium]